jgi:hypothetical protein
MPPMNNDMMGKGVPMLESIAIQGMPHGRSALYKDIFFDAF